MQLVLQLDVTKSCTVMTWHNIILLQQNYLLSCKQKKHYKIPLATEYVASLTFCINVAVYRFTLRSVFVCCEHERMNIDSTVSDYQLGSSISFIKVMLWHENYEQNKCIRFKNFFFENKDVYFEKCLLL